MGLRRGERRGEGDGEFGKKKNAQHGKDKRKTT